MPDWAWLRPVPQTACVATAALPCLLWLQGVKHFKDIKYTADVSYGEMFLQVGPGSRGCSCR